MTKFSKVILLLALYTSACNSSDEITTQQHKIDISKIIYAEAIYLKRFNGVLRPFQYGHNSYQLKTVLEWLKNNKNAWIVADKNNVDLNNMEVAISFYVNSGDELNTTLWLDKEKVILRYKTKDDSRLLLKDITKSELVILP